MLIDQTVCDPFGLSITDVSDWMNALGRATLESRGADREGLLEWMRDFVGSVCPAATVEEKNGKLVIRPNYSEILAVVKELESNARKD